MSLSILLHKHEFIAVEQHSAGCRKPVLHRVGNKDVTLFLAWFSQEDQATGLSDLRADSCMACLQIFSQNLTVMQHKVVIEDG